MSDPMKAKPAPLPSLPAEPVTARNPVSLTERMRRRATVLALFAEVRKYVDEPTTDRWLDRVVARLPQSRWFAPVRWYVRRKLDDLLPEAMLATLEMAILEQVSKP